MPATSHRDPLLGIAQIALRIGIVVIGITIGFVALAVMALLFFPVPHIAAQLAAAPAGTTAWAIAATVIGEVSLWLCLRFALTLRQMVGTVRSGDPFQPANADRLTRMGWLALGVQGCALANAPIVAILRDRLSDVPAFVSFSLGGLALALVLFILARIFAKGAAMRDDLHERRMTLTQLAERIDLTLANASILKTGKAKAIRFSTLEAICRELECQPGDILRYEP